MSIHCYAGMPGSGKSYNAVENQILPALREGRTVVTNIPLHLDRVRELVPTGRIVEFPMQAVTQNPDIIKDYVTPGCLFVLDEVWRIWPAGEKANKIPEVYKSLLAEHRHMVATVRNPQTGEDRDLSCQIVLVIQDAGNMAAFARKLIEQTFIHTKLTHVGSDGRFRVDIYHGPVTGTIGPANNRLNQVFGQYKPEIWNLYRSHTLSTVAGKEGANEKAVDRRGNVLRRPFFVYGIPAVLVVAGWGAWRMVREADRFAHPENFDHPRPAQAALHGQAVSAPPPQPRPVIDTFRRDEPVYKVLGYVKNLEHPERSYAVLSTGDRVRIFRGLDHCRVLDSDFLECEVAGKYFSVTGRSAAEGNDHAFTVSPAAGLPPGGRASAAAESPAVGGRSAPPVMADVGTPPPVEPVQRDGALLPWSFPDGENRRPSVVAPLPSPNARAASSGAR